MQKVNKVIRVNVKDPEWFFNYVSQEYSEYWFSYGALLGENKLLDFIRKTDKDILKQLREQEADFVSLYVDF